MKPHADNAQDITTVWEELKRPGGRIVYLVLDGGGGIRHPETGHTALASANTPWLDRLASESSCGLLEVVGPGITPGSGPGHLALFGYDPLRYRIGRGVLSALGIDLPLAEGDIAARINFARRDANGDITDRRAGRLTTARNRQLVEHLVNHIELDADWSLHTVSEHRAVLVLHDPGLDAQVADTDPQNTGVPAREPQAGNAASRKTATLVTQLVQQAEALLEDEDDANTLLLRGFERYRPLPGLHTRFGLRGLCLAQYPMYRGLSRLLGMDVAPPPGDLAAAVAAIDPPGVAPYDLYFLHCKAPDKAGEDADLDAKVAAIEAVDAVIPDLLEREPDVLVVTSDHATPAQMGTHSWHPVPLMIRSRSAEVDDVSRFDERHCRAGALGLRPGLHTLGLALAHAGRLQKFGA